MDDQKMQDLKNQFDAIPDQFKMLLSAAMEEMNRIGMITNGFRGVDGDDRKTALAALDLLVESAPTRHKKEISSAMRNAVQRFWTEKDAGMLPTTGETPVAH